MFHGRISIRYRWYQIIGTSDKSHIASNNASPYPTMHYFGSKIVHCEIWTGALWVLCNWSIVLEVTHWHFILASISSRLGDVQYIPRNMHTVFALLCFVVVIHWLIFPYPSGLLHWHCGNLTIAPVPAKQPWWIWINTSCEFIMNDCITTTKQSTTKLCAYFLGYTVYMCVCGGLCVCVSVNWAIVSSDNGLSFVEHQAITITNSS